MAEPRLLVDTSVFVDLLRGAEAARVWLGSVPRERLLVSMVTVAELVAGCRDRREQRAVEQEMSLYSLVWIDEGSSRQALELYRQLHLSHRVGFLDCVIAATALGHGLTVATLNTKDFDPVSGLGVLRPYP